ncbi:MAG: 30S ribosomal protein S12 methylthiotransferase RimO [Planctomycetota bacterium]|nr:30S ribosomal protein S12 methylthiotransferase RimO [Planctomycetota bacterium]
MNPTTASTTPSDAITRVAFVSLGCPKNLVDSERMLGMLRDGGIRPVNETDRPDAIVINTCGFLEASKDESLKAIRDAVARKERGELKRVVVAGCLVQRHRAKMLEWAPGIDALVGVFDRDHVVEAVRGTTAVREKNTTNDGPKYWIAANALQAAQERGVDTVGLTVHGKDGKGIGYFESDADRFRLTPRHWAYLRMSEGCNQRCSFCTIPSIRGKMRSKPVDRILDEARALFQDGTYELNLIGQDTTSFGMDIGYDAGLVGLLESLDQEAQAHGGGWIRLMYAYPTFFTDAMIDAIARLPNIVKYLDIPLQHASDRMLKLMRRNVTGTVQGDLITRLRDRIPGMAIRTTFITGFPGETEDDHQELLEFIEEHQFDAMGVFQYSREEGTPAGTMDLDPALHVDDETKACREAEIMELQQRIAFENAAFVAKQECQFDVLIEGSADGQSSARATTGVSDGLVLHNGRSYHQAPQIDSMTWVASQKPLATGELVRCTIVESEGYDFIARPTEDLQRTHSLPILR